MHLRRFVVVLLWFLIFQKLEILQLAILKCPGNLCQYLWWKMTNESWNILNLYMMLFIPKVKWMVNVRSQLSISLYAIVLNSEIIENAFLIGLDRRFCKLEFSGLMNCIRTTGFTSSCQVTPSLQNPSLCGHLALAALVLPIG